MSVRVFEWPRAAAAFCASLVWVLPVYAQDGRASHAEHQHELSAVALAAQQNPAPQDGAPAADEQDHSQHTGAQAAGGMAFEARDGSGTSWLPMQTPMYGVHQQAANWQLMWHGNAFVQYLADGGDRGEQQGGSINWFMVMAQRQAGGGGLMLRGMLSLETLTIRGCGYPDILATGETCDGEAIHDRQHPHDLFMELAAEYRRPIRGSLGWQVYGGLAGEPALGPVAYPHRTSAMPNPLAPITHHWLDATHITFGLVTAGIYDARWKLEGSLFNGREPDEQREDLDLAALDSVSGRLWFAPVPSLALQVSIGQLAEAEEPHVGEPRVDVTRVTASGSYHRQLRADRLWATTIAWGRNVEEGEATDALLAESSLALNPFDTLFGRFEVVGKAAHDLNIHGIDQVFTVSKVQVGYTRYFRPWHGFTPGIGGAFSVAFVPEDLRAAYGYREVPGAAVFFTVRPPAHAMQ